MSQYIFPVSQVADACQALLDIQEGRTPRTPKPAPVPVKPRRSCAQNLLRRAEFSAYYRQPVPYLRLLLDVLESPRALPGRTAREALASGDAAAIDLATKEVQAEINRIQQAKAEVAAAYGRAA